MSMRGARRQGLNPHQKKKAVVMLKSGMGIEAVGLHFNVAEHYLESLGIVQPEPEPKPKPKKKPTARKKSKRAGTPNGDK